MPDTQETTIQEFETDTNGQYEKYPEYQETDRDWLIVPKHWEVRRLKFCAKINPSKSEIEDLDPETQITFLPMENVSEQGNITYDECESLGDVIDGYTYFRDEDILVAKITPCFENGKGALAENLKNGIGFGTTEFVVLRPNNNLKNRFLYYVTASNLFRKVGEGHMKGAAGQKRVPEDFFQNFPQFIPPKEEQEDILEFLDNENERISNSIHQMERLISLIKEKKESVITRVVTEGLDPGVGKQKTEAKWLRSVPEHWDVNIFRRLCSLNQGLQIAQSKRFDNPGENRYKYLTVEDINADEDYNSDYIENPPDNVICDEDDVLLARTGATGEVISNFHGAFHNNFFKINFDRDRIEKDFLVYYLRNKLIKENLLAKAGLTTVPDLNHRYFLDTTLLLPPKEEQKEIVEYLNSELEEYDKSIKKIREGIDRLKEYRTALITEVVTGQIDVRGEV